VQWRIFDAGRIRAGIRVQNAKQREALANYEKTVLVALQAVEDALVAYGKEQVRHRSLTNEVRADRRALGIADEEYAKGLTDFLNVLEGQRSLYQAEDELAQSQTTVSENLIALYKALGGGWSVSKEKSLVQAPRFEP
jgi:outer membrane protein, multidrug efflux system